MFNFKEMISRVAHGQSPSSPARNNEPDTAEGFLCPLCMNAFGTQDELQNHYSTSHKDSEPPSGNTANAETSNVFHAFHQGVGDKYMQTHQAATLAEEARESIPEINSLDLQLEISQTQGSQIRNQEKELLGEEKVLAEQRAAALTEKVAILMATAEKAEMEKCTLAKRLAIVEAQLAHRENIDDAAVLRQELIQVQRVMDEMTREREMESDQLKRDLQNLQQKYNLLQSESKKAENIEKDTKRMEMLEESIQRKDELIAEINDKLTMLKDTVSFLENESFQKTSKLTESELELKKLKSVINELQSKEESGQKRIAELEEHLMEASLAQEKSSKELRRLEEAISCHEENARKDSQIISDLKSEILENSNTISNKNKELMALNEKVEILTSQLKEYTIMNEDLRCRSAEQARYLEDKMKLVSSMEDKEKEIQSALEKNVAQMDSLNKNYLELMGFIQAQIKDNNKVDSDSEKKILGQIESAVSLLTKKTSEFDHLATSDKQLLETLQKEGKNSTGELIKMLQTECKDKSEQLMEASRKISILSNEMQSKMNKEKAKTEELEAIINSLKLNLEQCRGDLARSNKVCQELEEKISDQRILMAKKEEEMCQLNAKYTRKVSIVESIV
ncbi:hypothetical protein J437_LFUL003704 [Ladona fulva]|uniref:C2H2-type domain-containing protein n=1 Tax=Ladona fulva TaxID=123851 RepID=A0A8K0NW04_LADFU|nr:hypothetical protein J437_LFUL003704 [Ladona fulva]